MNLCWVQQLQDVETSGFQVEGQPQPFSEAPRNTVRQSQDTKEI